MNQANDTNEDDDERRTTTMRKHITQDSNQHKKNPNMPETNQDSTSVYKDLVEFLQSSRQDIRLEATKAVLQVVHDRYVNMKSV